MRYITFILLILLCTSGCKFPPSGTPCMSWCYSYIDSGEPFIRTAVIRPNHMVIIVKEFDDKVVILDNGFYTGHYCNIAKRVIKGRYVITKKRLAELEWVGRPIIVKYRK